MDDSLPEFALTEGEQPEKVFVIDDKDISAERVYTEEERKIVEEAEAARCEFRRSGVDRSVCRFLYSLYIAHIVCFEKLDMCLIKINHLTSSTRKLNLCTSVEPSYFRQLLHLPAPA